MDITITIPEAMVDDFKEVCEFEKERYSEFVLNATVRRMNDSRFDMKFIKFTSRGN